MQIHEKSNSQQKDCFHDLASVAEHLFAIAKESCEVESGPVGAILLDKKGSSIYGLSSRVINTLSSGEKYLLNPTNHAERQIISWYYQNQQELNLPPPNQLTIISSLDPCLMCASSIVASGFNIGTISIDDYAGVNWKIDGFLDYKFAPCYRQKLLELFGYYKVQGQCSRTHYQYAAQNVLFKNQSIQKNVEEKILKLFMDSIVQFREQVGSCSPKAKDLRNLRDLSNENRVIQGLKQVYPNALSIILKEKVIVEGEETIYFEPNEDLRKLLTDLAASTPQAKNALALIDPYGNLLVAAADTFEKSPISSAILNAVTAYSEFHFNIINSAFDPLVQNNFRDSDAYNCLPTLADCTFIFLNALPGDEAISLQTVGIYGSSVENFVPKGGFLYINNYTSAETVRLEDVIRYVPGLYWQSIKICPLQAKIGLKQNA